MAENLYYLSLNHLASAITKGKNFGYFNIVPFNVNNHDAYDKTKNFTFAHNSLAYLLTSEYIHEQVLPEAIKHSFMEYSPDNNNSNSYIDTEIIKNQLQQFKNITPNQGAIYEARIIKLDDSEYKDLQEDMEYIIRVISYFISKYDRKPNTVEIIDETKKTYALMLKTYLPCIVFSFINNYNKTVYESVNKVKKNMNNKRSVTCLFNSLCRFSAVTSVSAKKIRDIEYGTQVCIKAFEYTLLFNSILRSCKEPNFALSFIWYERNIGAYQYYLTHTEYKDIINYICEYNASDNMGQLNIEKCVLLSQKLLSEYYFNIDDVLYYTRDCLEPNEDTAFYTQFYKELSSVVSLENTVEEYVENVKAISKSELTQNMQATLNFINNDELSQRFATTLINFIYFNDFWNRENFSVSNPEYSFKCKHIHSDLYEMNDVIFNLWLVDKNTECPSVFEKIYYSTDLVRLYPAIFDDKNAVLNNAVKNSVLDDIIKLPGCIISVIKAKSVFINNTKSPQKTGIFHLKAADFCGLSIESLSPDTFKPLFRHSAWVEFYHYINRIPDNEPPSFGLNYYLNGPVHESSTSSRNIVTSIVNTLTKEQDHSVFHNHQDLLQYNVDIGESMIDYIGICTSDTPSISCCSNDQRGVELNDMINAAEVRKKIAQKFADINKSVPDPDVTQVLNIIYTDSLTSEDRDYHSMDIYYPLGTKRDSYPVIVTINGEGGIYADKESYSLYGKYLSAQGFAVINFNNRVAPMHRYPCGFIDICRLMDHITVNAPKYKLDMERLFIIGNLMGAHLASQYAILSTNPEYKALFTEAKGLVTPVPNKMVINNGIYKFDDNTPYIKWYLPLRMSSELQAGFEHALDYMNEDFPETYITAYSNDNMCSASEVIVQKFKTLNIPFVYHKYGLLDESVKYDFLFDIASEAAKVFANDEIDFFRNGFDK